jgi:hypothetical protein
MCFTVVINVHHGFRFVFLAATRPGVHVVEVQSSSGVSDSLNSRTNLLHTQFVGGYEQNMMTTARLGSAYHGVVANLTTIGTFELLHITVGSG